MLLKTHLDIISRNEPITRKAKFWSSYMRALKGTDDIRAPEQSSRTPRSVFRPLYSEFPEVASKLESWPYTKSIYDEPSAAHDRVSSPGYRYQTISRDTYGYTPRSTQTSSTYRPVYTPVSSYKPYVPDYDQYYVPPKSEAGKAWDEHLERLAETEAKYPLASSNRIPYALHRATPAPPRPATTYRPQSLPPVDKVGYTYAGLPIYSRSGLPRMALYDLLNPKPSVSPSSIIRDPWWWKYPELRPFESPYTWRSLSPSYLRNSYLSPVKSTYLWTHHPIRPF